MSPGGSASGHLVSHLSKSPVVLLADLGKNANPTLPLFETSFPAVLPDQVHSPSSRRDPIRTYIAEAQDLSSPAHSIPDRILMPLARELLR